MHDATKTRLDVRLPREHKRLIEQAAEFMGQTLSAFSVAALVRQAQEVVDQFGTLRLSNRDRKSFLAALDRPAQPLSSLRNAAKRHAEKAAS